MKEIKLTLTIRPLRWLRNVGLAAVCAPILFSPQHAGQASEPQLTSAQIQRLAAINKIEAEIRPRMLPKATPKEVHGVAAAIVDESVKAAVDPLFILALIESESGFDIEAVSRTGARGLMQVIPGTWKKMSSAKRMFDPVENVRTGIRYVGHLAASGFGKRGGPSSVLLAYNQGPGRAAAYFRNGGPMPNEASVFIPRVMYRYQKFLAKFGENPRRARDLFREPALVASL